MCYISIEVIYMAFTRINEITPNGGEYSEIHFLDSDNNEVEEKFATNCVIRECTSDGTVVRETWARL